MYKITYKKGKLTITVKADRFSFDYWNGENYCIIHFSGNLLTIPKEGLVNIKPYTEYKYYKPKRF